MAEILGVRVDNLTKKEVLEKINLFLTEPKFHQIATVNPEFILAAQKDGEFRDILNGSDLNVADGSGLNLAFWKKGERLKERIAGADLLEDVLRLAVEHGLRVFFAVREDGLSSFEEIRRAIKRQYNGLDMGGMELSKSERNLKIDNYDILLCNFGAPDQEKFLESVKSDTPPHLCENLSSHGNNLNELNGLPVDINLQNQRCGGKIRLAIGVGGSFDFLTGKLKRAPYWMRQIGLEWLFRLLQQPKRIKRIWNAVVVFPVKVLFSK